MTEPCPHCNGGRAFTLHVDGLGNVVRDYTCLECGSTGETPDFGVEDLNDEDWELGVLHDLSENDADAAIAYSMELERQRERDGI